MGEARNGRLCQTRPGTRLGSKHGGGRIHKVAFEGGASWDVAVAKEEGGWEEARVGQRRLGRVASGEGSGAEEEAHLEMAVEGRGGEKGGGGPGAFLCTGGKIRTPQSAEREERQQVTLRPIR